MFNFEYKRTDKEIVLSRPLRRLFKISRRPVIPFPKEIVLSQKIGNGKTYFKHTGVYEDRVINIDCNFIANDKNEWINHVHEINNALSGNGYLSFSDDDSHYWLVKNVETNLSSRNLGIASDFDVTFTCDAYRYLYQFITPFKFNFDADGEEFKINNLYDTSYPIFRFNNTSINSKQIKIEKNGQIFLIDYNWREDVEYIELDVLKCILIEHRADGTEVVITKYTDGSYDNLKLTYGENVYRFTADAGAFMTEFYARLREL